MVELRGLGTRPRLSPAPATQLGGSAPFLARTTHGPDRRPTPYPILLARINARKENITLRSHGALSIAGYFSPSVRFCKHLPRFFSEP